MSAIKKPSIPTTSHLSPDIAKIVNALKENVELMTGARHGAVPLVALPVTATTAQIIATINTIIQRLNTSGS
jgi:hypothetical protein